MVESVQIMHRFIKMITNLWSKTNRFHRVVLLFIIFSLQPLPTLKYGFYCNDPALSYPFTGDTISWKWLIALCAILPFVIMLIVERNSYNKDGDRPYRRATRWYKEYIFGLFVNVDIMQLLKFAVVSPRPHFFDTCKPLEASTCADAEYVSSYTCSTRQWHWQSEQSFPSGHTSLCIHAGFFVAYYLHKRLPASPVVRSLQAVCIAVAVWCSVSRMTDHRHHWWDVLAGAVIASITLTYTIIYLCKDFVCAEKSAIAPVTANDEVANGNATNKGEILT